MSLSMSTIPGRFTCEPQIAYILHALILSHLALHAVFGRLCAQACEIFTRLKGPAMQKDYFFSLLELTFSNFDTASLSSLFSESA